MMSYLALNWAWMQKIVNTGVKFTLVACADFARDNGVCWMSQTTLAAMTSQGERTIRRHLAWLEKAGFLKRTKRVSADGRHRSDLVQLLGSREEFSRAARRATVERRTGGQLRASQRPNPPQASGQAVAADPRRIPYQEILRSDCVSQTNDHKRRKQAEPCTHGKCAGGPCRYIRARRSNSQGQR